MGLRRLCQVGYANEANIQRYLGSSMPAGETRAPSQFGPHSSQQDCLVSQDSRPVSGPQAGVRTAAWQGLDCPARRTVQLWRSLWSQTGKSRCRGLHRHPVRFPGILLYQTNKSDSLINHWTLLDTVGNSHLFSCLFYGFQFHRINSEKFMLGGCVVAPYRLQATLDGFWF